MTTQEIIDYYADLLIAQYRGEPKAYANIQAVVEPFVQEQVALLVRDAYNIDTAAGAQLDVLGKYANASRRVKTFSGYTTLNDADFRTLLKLLFVTQRSGSSLSDIQNLIADFLPGVLQVFDNQNMQLDYYFNSNFGSQELAEAFYLLGLLPKPMGVQLSSLIFISDLEGIWGWGSYSLDPVNVSGFNTYDVYDTDTSWISYQNAIGV